MKNRFGENAKKDMDDIDKLLFKLQEELKFHQKETVPSILEKASKIPEEHFNIIKCKLMEAIWGEWKSVVENVLEHSHSTLRRTEIGLNSIFETFMKYEIPGVVPFKIARFLGQKEIDNFKKLMSSFDSEKQLENIKKLVDDTPYVDPKTIGPFMDDNLWKIKHEMERLVDLEPQVLNEEIINLLKILIPDFPQDGFEPRFG